MTAPVVSSRAALVRLVLELPPSVSAVAAAIDPAVALLDETSGEASGSGWRLFEPVAGEVPPWLSIGEFDGDRYQQEVRLPDRGDPVVWNATCQVGVSWTVGAHDERMGVVLNSAISFVLPAGGRHTVTGALDHVPGGIEEAASWRLLLQ